ncbi:hypothetical protein DBP19_35150 [Streptomyces sp. CS090A]|uniref:hypothetical protein n=1 Tax=Streptomyces sp. CS090A TaxID=2162710 RepID=UPI000D50C360|nr:hypothetical protein [Streptomyces sp. CS090A]PVC80743.1 hypothetical protein DBP19_35150 [Streptomyces sp. CS090A]
MPTDSDPCAAPQRDEPGNCGAGAPHTVYVLIAVFAPAFLLYVAYDQPAVRTAVGPAGGVLLDLLPGVAGHVLDLMAEDLPGVVTAAIVSSATALASRVRRASRCRGEHGTTPPPSE